MKDHAHRRGDSLSSISMNGDNFELDLSPSVVSQQDFEIPPLDEIPHLLLPDLLHSESSSNVKLQHRRKKGRTNSLSPLGVPTTICTRTISNHSNDDGQDITSPRFDRALSTSSKSRRITTGDIPTFGYCKPSRYTFAVLGDEPRLDPGQKSNMVRKIFSNTRTVLPLQKSVTEGKTKIHRRDSFASLPQIAEIGISKEDLLLLGNPTKMRHIHHFDNRCA